MVEQVTFQTIFQFLQTVSIMVGIAYYLMILQNQQKSQQSTLETRQAQLFMQLYNKVVSQEGIDNLGLLVRAEWSSYEEWVEKYQNDEEYAKAFVFYLMQMEGVGVLIKEKLVSIRLVAMFFAGITRQIWEKYKDIILEERKHMNYPRYASEWEYTYNELMKYMKEHPELAT